MILRFFAYVAIGMLFSNAYAADLAVLPVGLSLSANYTKGMITVSNQGKEAVVIQAETVSWKQLDSENQYEPTQELLVNPPLFTIHPGRSQVLRVGLRQVKPVKQEIAYRLLLREVPNAPLSNEQVDEGKQGNIRVLLQLSLPIYIAPAVSSSQSQWSAHQDVDGAVALKLNNNGNVHMLVNELTLRNADADKNAEPLATIKVNTVVFPAQSHHWKITPESKLKGQRFVLEVKTDKGLQNVALDLGPR
jgi:fimbrial chaperone protein